jgi:hypothetical protein
MREQVEPDQRRELDVTKIKYLSLSVLSVETLIFSKLIVARRRSVVVVDISTTGAKLPLRIERAQFSERNKVEPQGLFYSDDEALTLFKLLLTDQAQDWLYALPEEQADSFHRLQEAFMSRYTPNPLQRYQKASHMWSRMQQDNESVDSYFTAIKSAANQIKLRDEQQLCFCLIRGLKPHLRLHVLQNNHDNLEPSNTVRGSRRSPALESSTTTRR